MDRCFYRDNFIAEAAVPPSLASSKTADASSYRQPDLSGGYSQHFPDHLMPVQSMVKAILNNPCGFNPSPRFNFLQSPSCEESLELVDAAFESELNQLFGPQMPVDVRLNEVPGEGAPSADPAHNVEAVPSTATALYLNDGVGDDASIELNQWLQEDPPVDWWSAGDPAANLDEESYLGLFDAHKIADRLDSYQLFLKSDLLSSAAQEIGLKSVGNADPAPANTTSQQYCEGSGQPGSKISLDEVFPISHTKFEDSLGEEHYPQVPSGRLHSSKRRSQRTTKRLKRRKPRRSGPTRSRRPPPQTSNSKKAIHVRLEEVNDEKGNCYKWNRRAGPTGSWEDKAKKPVDMVRLLGDPKTQLRSKVRPGGGKLAVELSLSDAGTFEGEVLGGGRLHVSVAVMVQMCKDPQRRDSFEAILYKHEAFTDAPLE